MHQQMGVLLPSPLISTTATMNYGEAHVHPTVYDKTPYLLHKWISAGHVSLTCQLCVDSLPNFWK